MDNEMRIIELSVRGIRKLEAIDIKFTDGVNVLMGSTQQGKTSVLESLILGLRGPKKEVRDFVHHGKENGSIVETFSVGGKTYRVERKLERGKPPSLKLQLMDGDKPKKIETPQKFLEELIPALGETPGSFLKKSALEKLRFVLEHHGVDMTEWDKKIAEHTAKRQELTAQQKLFAYAENAPVEKNSEKLDALKLQLAEAEKKNAGIDKKYLDMAAAYKTDFHAKEKAYKEYAAVLEALAPAESDLNSRNIKIGFEKTEIARLEKELEERKVKLAAEEKSYAGARKSLDDTKANIKAVTEPDRDAAILELEKMRKEKEKELVDVTGVTAEIKVITDADDETATYKRDHESFKAKAEAIKGATAKIKEVKDLLLKTISEIPSKLEGLVIEPGEEGDRPKGLYVNGIFSEEWSGAEGFAIAAKLLRRYSGQSVLIIDQGESIYYDAKAFREFCEWARNDGVQVIISVVGENEPGPDADKGFVIEEGKCREINVTREEEGDLL